MGSSAGDAAAPAPAFRAVARVQSLAVGVFFVFVQIAAAAVLQVYSFEIAAVVVAQVSVSVQSSYILCSGLAFIRIAGTCHLGSLAFREQASSACCLMSTQIPSIAKIIVALDELYSVAPRKTELVWTSGREIVYKEICQSSNFIVAPSSACHGQQSRSILQSSLC